MINDMTCETDLMAAVEKADVSAILHCLAGGANVNAGSENGWTPLMLAILRGSPAIVKLLLEYGADPNLTTQSYENPSRSALTVAISNGRVEVVQMLVAYGADIDSRGVDGLTPIDLAEKLSRRPFHQAEIGAIALFLKEAKVGAARQPVELAVS